MESIAPYLNLRTGLSPMASDSFSWQSVSSYSGDEVDLIYGGEFGIYFRGGGLGLGLGVLVHTYDPVTGGHGNNAAGTSLYTVDSKGMAYGPKLTIDYQFSQTPTYNWKFGVSGGYQFIKVENTYNMTTTGQALVAGQSTIDESLKTATPFAQVEIGTEFLLTKTTTMNVTLGYHHSLDSDWTYGEGGTNFVGTHSQGDKVLFEDGSRKLINWSYPFIQLGFQFYVDTVR